MTVSSWPTLERVASAPRPIPTVPATIAPQPTRPAPRLVAQIPAATARIPTRIGHRRVRVVNGGIASQEANAPRKIPRAPIPRGCVSREAALRMGSAYEVILKTPAACVARASGVPATRT
jgi:hypothetical protein